jgi:broad specificity phosphatase PhoE
MRRIHLVRHGRSSMQHDGAWMYASGVSRYEDAYDEAGIRDDDHPPAVVRELAGAAQVVASDLARAIASAERLTRRDAIAITPLLREIRIEPPRWIPFKLPIDVWDGMSYLEWFYRLRVGADHEYVRRAHDASNWLIQRAAEKELLAVTHGAFRLLLVPALRQRGYVMDEGPRRYHNWSVWTFSTR